MIINASAVLVLLMNVLRLPLAILVIGLALPLVAGYRDSLDDHQRRQLENRLYLLLLLALSLVVLNVLSWPLLYWMWQSYVPELPGAMCIYGVTQLGTGSLGITRHLPGMALALQLFKPLLLFVGGLWFVLYWINRQTARGPLTRSVLVLLLMMGAVSLVDSTFELGYLLIPKQENLPTVGCCTNALATYGSRFSPQGWLRTDDPIWLYGAYYGSHAVMILLLVVHFAASPRTLGVRLGVLSVVMLLTTGVSGLFLIEVAAPLILQLPHHHCAYDLISAAPESVLGAAAFVLAGFSIGWARLTWWLGRCEDTSTLLPIVIDRTIFLALFAYLFSLILFSLEFALNLMP